ncbi:uncharacterized protein LOC111892374 [Lactuca sativa]|uniref:Uncharacterized protein n=1 Tax=Lactuca sativa TaxID=4236 RepID=A0A9R1WKC4_LACSA|nr:uncharacterized protein LOC111892374 [Lactuca sativa]KAJ0224021.1 hypothetical protein LSAT_V11C200097370 [Lactuca sativa]
MGSEQNESLDQVIVDCGDIPDYCQFRFLEFAYKLNKEEHYGKPMWWIGMYIALASLFCIIVMVADLLHGLRNRKFWFPCKYFTLNAATVTVIGVAIKLPNGLTDLTPSHVDRIAKLGGLSFMCTIMANLLPSLATMESKELVSNMIGLGILVITLAVNLCIQISTGVVSYNTSEEPFETQIGSTPLGILLTGPKFIATIYVAMLLLLLMIYACSCLAILKTKQILESKYQAAHQEASKELQQGERLTVEKLQHHVRNYWIMAGTGSPQFMTVCSATTSASGVICLISTALHVYIIIPKDDKDMMEYDTDYKWSMLVILIIQFIGVILGTLAPISRCFAALSFKLSEQWIRNHIKVFKVESYWTQKLSDWEKRRVPNIPFRSPGLRGKIVIEKLKILFLSICIQFQETFVVACKMIGVIPLLFLICVSYCWKWLKAMFSSLLSLKCVSYCWKRLKAMFSSPDSVSERNPENQGKDDSRYVLQLEDDTEFAERTLKGISKSVNRLIQKAEKKQPKNLMKLLEGSSGFKGVEEFDSPLVPSLGSKEYLNCWSLPLVTLTAIAIFLKDEGEIDELLSGVDEGLVYVAHVEESLNVTDEDKCIQKVAKTLCVEVEVRRKWFGNKLPKPGYTAGKILKWLRDISRNMVNDHLENDDSKYSSIAANSMYRITETLILSHQTNIDQVSQDEIFKQLSSMIADILAACLTNLPQAIAMKCHAREIEKREASVHAAAQLLGETTKIINTLQHRQLPNLTEDKLPFIDKWRDYYLMHP